MATLSQSITSQLASSKSQLRIELTRLMLALLLILLRTFLSGCASPQIVPVAVECPTIPALDPTLMLPPRKLRLTEPTERLPMR